MNTNRYEYIDALRGIAILFIVFGHIPMFCYGLPEAAQLSSFRAFTSMVQLPLFFFISGFLFSVKTVFNKSGGVKFEYIYRRARQLLLPAIVFGGLYLLVNGGSVLECIMDKFKSGYWFTWSLFEFLMMQVILEWIVRKFAWKEDGTKYAIVCIGGALGMYVLSLPIIYNQRNSLSGILGLPLLRYFLYFVVGRLIRVYLYKLCMWEYRDVAVAMIVMIFAGLAIATWGINKAWDGIFFHLHLILFELSALLLFFAMFYRHRNYFVSSDRLMKVLVLVGRRTLDIYLLHYFFLPKDLHVIGSYFMEHPAPVIEFIVSFVVTIMIVAVCLLISELLRSSKLVAKWALGGK